MFSTFDFSIEHIKGSDNSIPDFLTREYLQNGLIGMMSREVQVDDRRRPIIWHRRTMDCVIRTIPNSDCANAKPWALADRLLGPNYFGSERSPMDWTSAEKILIATGAAYIRHYEDAEGKIQRSIFIMKTIKSFRDWRGRDMTTLVEFGSTLCSYLEYKQALFEIFCINCPNRNHSWFMILGRYFNPHNRPLWFDEEWWPSEKIKKRKKIKR